MKKRLGKLLAMSLAMLMLISIIPLAAFAAGEGSGEGGVTTAEEKFSSPTEVKNVYTLTINYFYGDIPNSNIGGTKAAEPYVAVLQDGADYDVESPAIKGFTASNTRVAGKLTKDETVNVIYNTGDANYTVTYLFQTVDGKGYEADENYPMVTKGGTTGALVDPEEPVVEGFVILPYEKPAIAAEGTDITIKYDRVVNTVKFVANDGSFVDQITLRYGEEFIPDNNEGGDQYTTRPGYGFEGWYTDKDFDKDTLVDELHPLEMGKDNVTLYAKWGKGKATYKIIYMLQNPDNRGQFDYLTHTTAAAVTVGTNVSNITTVPLTGAVGTAIVDAGMTTNGIKDGAGNATCQPNVTVAGDGSTVLEVYLYRKTFTVEFYKLINWKWTLQNVDTIRALYGADIKEAYLAVLKKHTDVARWEVESSTSNTSRTMEKMLDKNTKLYAKNTGDITYYTYNCFQVLPGSEAEYDKKVNNKYYKIDPNVSRVYRKEAGMSLVPGNQPSMIGGFKYAGLQSYEKEAGYKNDERVGYVFYDRLKFDLKYIDLYGAKTETWPKDIIDVYFEAPITAPANPEREGYDFDGWYTNAMCTPESKFEFTANPTMPAGNLSLYAAWKPKVFTVSFDLNAGEDVTDPAVNPETQVGLKYLVDFAKDPGDPTRAGYRFMGWKADGEDKIYNFDRPITKSLNLVAQWETDPYTYYTVYHYKAGSTNVLYPTQVVENQTPGNTVTVFAHEVPEEDMYAPLKATQSLELNPNGEENVIIFEYAAFDVLPYKVVYLYNGEPIEGVNEKVVDDNAAKIVTETYVPISGYYPRRYQITERLTYVKDGYHVITFEYLKNEPSTITIEHYLRESGAYKLKDSETDSISVGETVLASKYVKDSYTGYSFTEADPASMVVETNHTKVMKLYYDPIEYTLTYNNNPPADTVDEGEFTTDAALLHGGTLAALSFEATKLEAPGVAYKFLGWSETKSATAATYVEGDAIPEGGAKDDVIVYAVWEKVSVHNVTYYRNHDDSDTTNQVEGPYYLGQTDVVTINNPFDAPSIAYEFAGWTLGSTDGTLVTAGSAVGEGVPAAIAGDVKYYAKWTEKTEYALTYIMADVTDAIGKDVLDRRTGEMTVTESVYAGQSLTAATAASLSFEVEGDYYSFVKWIGSDGEEYIEGAKLPDPEDFVDGKLTLTGVWKRTEGKWGQVIYDNNAAGAKGVVSGSQSDPKWYPITTENVALKDKGTLAATEAYFLGWSTSQHGLIEDIGAERAVEYATSVTVDATEVTVYAVWGVKTYTETAYPDYYYGWVSYYPGIYTAATGSAADSAKVLIYSFNPTSSEISETTASSRTVNLAGKSFTYTDVVQIGWSEGETGLPLIETIKDENAADFLKLGSKYMIIAVGETPMQAVWAIDEDKSTIPDYLEYNVKYENNGGIGGPTTRPGDKKYFPEGGKYTIETKEQVGISREGYFFKGWNTETDGSGIDFTPTSTTITFSKDRLHIVPRRLVLYAQWVPAYTLTYDDNGANAAGGNVTVPASGEHEEKDIVEIDTSITGSWDGWEFLGWSEKADDTGAQYPANASGLTLTMPAANVTLYAVWAPVWEPELIPDPEDNYEEHDFGPGITGGKVMYDGQPHGVALSGVKSTDEKSDYTIIDANGSTSQPASPTFTEVQRSDSGAVARNVSITVTRSFVNADGETISFPKDLSTNVLIYPRPLVVKPEDDTDKIYNGQPQTGSGKAVEVAGDDSYSVVSGQELKGAASREETNAETYELAFGDSNWATVVTSPGGADKSHNYDISYKPGKFIINKRTVTVKGETYTKPYTGSVHTMPEKPYTEDGLLTDLGHTITGVDATFDPANPKNPRGYDIVIDISKAKVVIGDDDEVNKNYIIEKENGKYTITMDGIEAWLEIKGGTETVTYNGFARGMTSPENYNVVAHLNDSILSDFTVEGVSMDTGDRGIDAETYDVPVLVSKDGFVIRDSDGDDVTDIFGYDTTPGKLIVEKADVQIYPVLNAAGASSLTITSGATVTPYIRFQVEGVTGHNTWLGRDIGADLLAANGGLVRTLPANIDSNKNPNQLFVENLKTKKTGTHTVSIRGNESDYDADNYNVTLGTATLVVNAATTPPIIPTTPTDPTDPGTPVVPVVPGGPVVPVPPVPPVEPTEPEPPTVIENEPTPMSPPDAPATDTLADDATPAAAPAGAWALLNLICAILCAVFAILLFVTAFKRNKKKEQDEEAEAEMQAAAGDEEEEDERNKKSGIGWRILSIILGIISPIVFLLTENIRLPMIFTDRWTLLMILLLVVQVIGMLLMRRARNQEDDEDEEEAAAQA